MNLSELVRTHLEITMSTKVDACERNGGPTDLQPMMIWIDSDDKTSVAIVDSKTNTMDYMPKALSFVHKQNPKMIMFMSESLGKSIDSLDELANLEKSHKHGDLKKMYDRRGPLSGVREMITMSAIDMNSGKQVQAVLGFSYDDKGIPAFHEPNIHEVPEEFIDRANVSSMLNAFYLFMLKKKSELN